MDARVLGAAAIVVAVAGAGTLWYNGDERRAARHLERGLAALSAEDPATALIELKNAASLRPSHPESQFRLAEAFLRTGDGEKAQLGFETARDLGFRHPQLELLRVRAVLMQRKYEDAAGLIETADAEPGERADWLMLEGEAELGARRGDKAWSAFSRVLDEDPDNAEARRGMARVAIAEGDPSEAERQLDKAIGARESDVQTWVLKGELELATDKREAALASFERAVEIDAESAGARSGMVRALLALGRANDAGRHVQALARTHPDAVVTRFLQATVARALGDLAKARERLTLVVNAVPDHRPSVLLFATLDLEAGAPEAVVERLAPWIESHPGSIVARRLMAAALLELREPDQAIGVLEPLEARGVRDAAVLHLIGTAYGQKRDHERATRYLARARELAPDVAGIGGQVALSHLAAGESSSALAELGADEDGTDNARVLRVAALLDSGSHDEAVAAARALVASRPDNARAENLLGAALEARGETVAAREWYQRASKTDPGYLTARFNVARVARAEGRLEEARAIYDAVLANHENHAGALVGLATLSSREGRPRDALALLEQARSANPHALAPRIVLAGFHLRRGNRSGALEVAEEAARIDGDDPDVLRALGMSRLASGLAAKAVTALHRLEKIQPRSADVTFRLALAYEQQGNHATMRKYLERTLELDPDHRLAKAGIGNLDIGRGEFTRALETAHELVAADPDSIAGHLLAGDALTATGRYAESVVAYRKAYARAPNGVTVRKLYDGLARAGESTEALELMHGWLEVNPTDIGARLLVAGLLDRIGRAEFAILEYERVLYEQPANVMALNNLAWLYARRDDPRALETAERAYAALPGNPQVVDTYGWMLYRAGRLDEAMTHLDRAHEAAPGDPSIRFHRAAALARTGSVARARDELEALLSKDVRFREREAARELLARLR